MAHHERAQLVLQRGELLADLAQPLLARLVLLLAQRFLLYLPTLQGTRSGRSYKGYNVFPSYTGSLFLVSQF